MEQQKKYLEGSNLYWTKVAGLLALLDAVVMTIRIFFDYGLFYYGFHYFEVTSVANTFLPLLLAFALAILFLEAKGRNTKSKCGKATVILVAAFFVCRIMNAFDLWGGMPSLLSFTDMTAVFYGNGSFFERYMLILFLFVFIRWLKGGKKGWKATKIIYMVLWAFWLLFAFTLACMDEDITFFDEFAWGATELGLALYMNSIHNAKIEDEAANA